MSPRSSLSLPTSSVPKKEGGWCQLRSKPRLLPGESALRQTSPKQQPASDGVAKAMPTASCTANEQKQQTQELSLASLLPAGNQARILSFLPEFPLCGYTGTVKIADGCWRNLLVRQDAQAIMKKFRTAAWLMDIIKTEASLL